MASSVEIITLICTNVIAFLGGSAGKWLIDYRKERNSEKMDANTQAFTVYNELVKNQQEQIRTLIQDVRDLEGKYAEKLNQLERDRVDYLKENGELRADVRALKAQVDILSKMNESNANFHTRIIDTQEKIISMLVAISPGMAASSKKAE